MASAALFKNGKLVAAVCEERFTRNKNEHGYPKSAIDFCLKEGKLKPEDLDYVASGSLELSPIYEATKKYSRFTIDDYVKENNEYWKPKLIEGKEVDYFTLFEKRPNKNYDFSFMEREFNRDKWNELFREERIKNLTKQLGLHKEKIIVVDHHTGHACYAYFMSPFRNNVLIVTSDSWGDDCNASVWIGNRNKLELKLKSPNNNLARLYRYMTLLLGMKPNEHEYKVMGLAPYATEHQIRKPYKIFKKTLYIDGIDFRYKEKPTDNYFWFKEKLEGCRFDAIAGALQNYVEDVMAEWIRNLIKTFQSNTIVFSGGLANNIKINKRLSELEEVKNIFVPSGCGDESQSIGAALFVINKFQDSVNIQVPMHDYHGPSISLEGIEKILAKNSFSSNFIIEYNVSNKILAGYLSDDLIIGRCSGRSEFGPRSLGNRSILANPSKIENLRKINNQIKYRDFWMPFSPSILIEKVQDYVINPKNICSPYMTMAFDATELAKKDLVAAVHPSDFTLRPQFVEKKHNPQYHNLISEFENITGIGGLLNTSLNLHGEPIVGNVEDAIHTLVNSELDGMVIDNCLLMRKRT